MKIRACIFYDETLHAPRRNVDIIVEDGLYRREPSGKDPPGY
jgi:hypothetical protein